MILIGCGVAFSGSGNGSDQKEQEASVTDTKKDTAEEKKSSDAEVKKEDAVKEKVSEEKIETKEEAKRQKKKMIPRKPVLHPLRLQPKRKKQNLPPVSRPAVPARRRQRQKQITPVLPIAASRSIRIPG